MTSWPIFRFAPSPNGVLHLGHAYSALLNEDLARLLEGALLLRIEDIDTARCTPVLEQSMMEDLQWLGLGVDGPVMRQSERFEIYADALHQLRGQGLIYPAFLSRRDIKRYSAQNPDARCDPDGQPIYPGPERAWSDDERVKKMASGAPFAWRLDMARAQDVHPLPEAAIWGDCILARKDTPTSYHLSVVVDDAAQGVTHVVRGQDLAPAKQLHEFLGYLLGLPIPRYFHHRLILDDDHQKLAKSSNATGIRVLRDKGVSASEIRKMVGLTDDEVARIAGEITA